MKTEPLDSSRPIFEAILFTSVLIIMSVMGSFFLYLHTSRYNLHQIRDGLMQITQAVSTLVDADQHDFFQSRDQEASPEYRQAIQPLHKMWVSLKDIRYIYTARQVDGKIYFVLDPAPEEDTDQDGVIDHSYIMEEYEDPDQEMIAAFQTGKPQTSKQPYKDKWGTFISCYVPLFDSKNRQVGIVGIDMLADHFEDHMNEMRMAAVSGLVIPILVSGIFGFMFYFFRRASLKTTQELFRSQKRFELMANAAPAMLWMLGPNKSCTFVNQGWTDFTGQGLEAQIGDSWQSSVHPDDRKNCLNAYSDAFDRRETFSIEYRLKHHSGDYFWVLSRGVPRYDYDGQFAGYIGCCIDIHDRKLLETQFLQSQKMETVGVLAGGIAHDLNNQLTPLVGYLDFIIEQVNPEDINLPYLLESQKAAKRCADIAQNILHFSRHAPKSKNLFNLCDLLRDLNKFYSKILPATILFQVHCPKEPLPIYGNSGEIHAMITNMIANAKDAMSSGGQLLILAQAIELKSNTEKRGRRAGLYACLEIRDTGPGIAPENLQKIFEPFFTTKPKGKGTGLGLSMATRVCQDHGGWIEASNQSANGAVFFVYLPLSPETWVDKKSSDPSSVALPHGHEMVLVADDEESVRNAFKTFLEHLGYRVVLTCNTDELIEEYQAHYARYDLVIIDMTMPKMTGRQTLIKLLEIQPNAKIILCSGYTEEGSVKELLSLGAKEFLHKPFTIQPLAQMLRKVIDQV